MPAEKRAWWDGEHGLRAGVLISQAVKDTVLSTGVFAID